MRTIRTAGITLMLVMGLSSVVLAQGIKSPAGAGVMASFDIVGTRLTTSADDIIFHITVSGEAGSMTPEAIGTFENSEVYAYVWPTSLDSAQVGFDSGQGMLALAVTFHPDFDDAAYGKKNRDTWHPHWVVLVEDAACGEGALKVRDIPAGAKPKLPETWPGVPLLIDSPLYPMNVAGESVEVRVPKAVIGAVAGVKYDGVTSALKVNANLHAPLLCIAAVLDVASGDLSLSGTVE